VDRSSHDFEVGGDCENPGHSVRGANARNLFSFLLSPSSVSAKMGISSYNLCTHCSPWNSHICLLSLKDLDSKTKKIETGIYGNLQRAGLLKVTAIELGAFVHHEVRWSDRIIVVDHKLVVIHASSSFCENLTSGQYPRYEPAKKYSQNRTPGAVGLALCHHGSVSRHSQRRLCSVAAPSNRKQRRH